MLHLCARLRSWKNVAPALPRTVHSEPQSLWKNASAVLHLHFKSGLVRFQLGLMTDLPGSLLCDSMNASRALHHLSKSGCLDPLLLMTGLLGLLLLMTAPLVPCPHLLLIELSSLRPLMIVV